jgi:cytochrome c1
MALSETQETMTMAKTITNKLIQFLPTMAAALQQNPIGAMVLVCLAAFAVVAYAIAKLA